MMRTANIYKKDIFCGILSEMEDGYHFIYDAEYMATPGAVPLSPTMPFQEEEYHREMMFPVFDGLIPEGWLLDIAQRSWKIDSRDRMALLIACCRDCIGDISVIEG
jgi:serine/threonine-protein kinase HipA